MTIKLTEAAAEEVKNSKEEGHYLRVAVKGGGCSGFEYKLTFVDRKSDLYLDGTVLDYYSDISKRGFTFENPNAVKSCGCGSSFQA